MLYAKESVAEEIKKKIANLSMFAKVTKVYVIKKWAIFTVTV